eukprot:290303-Amphidinium_carterae.1
MSWLPIGSASVVLSQHSRQPSSRASRLGYRCSRCDKQSLGSPPIPSTLCAFSHHPLAWRTCQAALLQPQMIVTSTPQLSLKRRHTNLNISSRALPDKRSLPPFIARVRQQELETTPPSAQAH